MATYGSGQMLGSGINPESFKQDYSGFSRAAEIEAQGISNLGASISGVIKDFRETKKEQKKVDAYNKASVKAIEAAITLGGSYGINGTEETLRPFLESYNDPNLSPIEKAALLDEGKGMISNVFKRFDASQADAIQRAQIYARNAPSPKSVNLQAIKIRKNINGKQYDVPGTFNSATGEYLESNAGVDTSFYIPDNIDNALNLPMPQGLTYPDNGDIPDGYLLPSVDFNSTSDVSNLTNVQGNLPDMLPMQPGIPTIPQTPSLDGSPSEKSAVETVPLGAIPVEEKKIEAEQEPVIISIEKLRELTDFGVRPKGTLNPDGTFSVTSFNTGALPQGMTIESDGKNGFKITQMSGIGDKAKEKVIAQKQMRDESFRLNQANTEEAFNLLDEIGTNNSLFAAGQKIFASAFPASKVGEMQSFLERINGENSFEKMNKLRASSPTGGAAGTMTEKEWPRFEGRFAPLIANSKKDTLSKSLSLNLLNAFEATNGTPDDAIKLLDEKKIDQVTYDNYVSDYIKNRQIAKVNNNGVEGRSYDWTKLNKNLLKKSTIFEVPARSTELKLEEQELIERHKTK